MKKFFLSLFAFALVCAPAYALEAAVPEFDVYVDNIKLEEHKNFQYPILVYKDITYFPMTYDYVHILGLTSSWVDGKFYLAYCPTTSDWPEYWGEYCPAPEKVVGELISYPVYVNGKLIDNSKEEYPLFNADGITYFPLTWRFATEEFGMSVDWNGSLIIGTSSGGGSGFACVEGNKAYFQTDFFSHEVNDDNTITYHNIGSREFVLDADANTVTPYDGKIEFDENWDVRSEDYAVSGGNLVYKDIVIADISALAEAEKQREDPLGLLVYAAERDIGGGRSFVSVSISYKQKFPTHRNMSKSYYFIKNGADFKRLDLAEDTRLNVGKTEYIGGVSYVGVTEYKYNMGMYFGAPINRTLAVYPDGEIMLVSDADHEAVELLGQIDGKIAVKATWKSEHEAVSAVNDGYFTVESDGKFTKIYPYVYCNGAVVLNNQLYLLVWMNSAVINASAGEEIKFE